MKLLDALLPQREVQRYTLSEYLQNVIKYGGYQDTQGYRTTYKNMPAEPIGETFTDYVLNAFRSDVVVYGCEQVRLRLFTEARFQFQAFRKGRPAELYGVGGLLSLLERPWPGGTTGDLLARMLLDADIAGNAFLTVIDDEVVRLRPDWVDIILAPRHGPNGGLVGMSRVGYVYYEGGKDNQGGPYAQGRTDPEAFLVEDVAHFAPSPDPLASYRGMSWLTPVVREIQADISATRHKLKFFENAATPNLSVSLPKEVTPEQFDEFVELMDKRHKGVDNAYETLYTGGGADVTVVGANMQQLDFKVTQGAGETRIALAAGVPPTVASLSEGMQGSSLNAGNFGVSKRQFAQGTMRHLWRNAAGSLEMLVPPPNTASRLWYDDRDVPYLFEDAKDAAEIRARDAQTARTLTDAGAKWDAIIDYIASSEPERLRGQHSGLYSVQLQPPSTTAPEAAVTVTDAARAAQMISDGWTVVAVVPSASLAITNGG